ncbi:MAG: nuclear transport factor 2 family protein [Actinomycetota bacterium]|nr:nuclear transport factor 2 family protein [Actinomycetota bacterium]
MDERAAAEFVEAFATAWAAPSPDGLVALLAEDGVLIQPLSPRTVGRDRARAEFARTLRFMPDLRATVHRWSTAGEFLYIDFTLSATFGGRPLAWDVVDRITLRDGLVTERIAYFDGLALALELAKRPRGLPALLAARLGR